MSCVCFYWPSSLRERTYSLQVCRCATAKQKKNKKMERETSDLTACRSHVILPWHDRRSLRFPYSCLVDGDGCSVVYVVRVVDGTATAIFAFEDGGWGSHHRSYSRLYGYTTAVSLACARACTGTGPCSPLRVVLSYG